LTFITGHGRPLTRMTSPHNPEWLRSSYNWEPFAANIMSDKVIATSYSPCGSSARSIGSCS